MKWRVMFPSSWWSGDMVLREYQRSFHWLLHYHFLRYVCFSTLQKFMCRSCSESFPLISIWRKATWKSANEILKLTLFKRRTFVQKWSARLSNAHFIIYLCLTWKKWFPIYDDLNRNKYQRIFKWFLKSFCRAQFLVISLVIQYRGKMLRQLHRRSPFIRTAFALTSSKMKIDIFSLILCVWWEY